MAMIPRAELEILLVTRNQLIEENSSLKSQLSRLLNEAQESYIRIKQKDIEIEELRRENEQLRKRIIELESTVASHASKISHQASEISHQASEISHQASEISHLKSVINDMKVQDECNKFVIAIQDLNSRYNLETDPKLLSIKKKIRSLRTARVSSFHYILEDDDWSVASYKVSVTLSKIRDNMTKE